MARNYYLRGVSVRKNDRRYHWIGTQEGFCQTHYKRRRIDGKPGYRYFCIQQAANVRDGVVRHTDFRFLTTSSDGEPDSPYPYPVNQIPIPPPTSKLNREIAQWIVLMNTNPPLFDD